MFSSIGRGGVLGRISRRHNLLRTSQRNQTNTYEGDGKTKVNILNKDPDSGLMIDSYTQYGFRLNNGLKIVGPMAIFPRSVLSWNISNFKDINEETLSLFCILEPKIDVLVLGIGDHKVTREFSHEIFKFIQKYKINIEILETDQACATFNFLTAEQRMVAAAMIPPANIRYNEDDLMQTKTKTDPRFSTGDFM